MLNDDAPALLLVGGYVAVLFASGRRAPLRDAPNLTRISGRRADVNEHGDRLKTRLLSATPIALSSRPGAKRRRRTFARRDARRGEGGKRRRPSEPR